MGARLVSIINMKGGVGKSTTAVTLAETLAVHHRRRVLLIDLDPQTNASIMVGGPERWNAARKADRTLDAFFDAYATGEKPAPLKTLVDKQVTDLKDNKGKTALDRADGKSLRGLLLAAGATAGESGIKTERVASSVP